MRPYKKPKYRLDPKKIEGQFEQKEKKENDWSEAELYQQMLREKSRHRHR